MLEAARRAVEGKMQDRVRVTRPGDGPGTVDSVTLAHTKASAQVIYLGKAMYGDRLSGHPRQEGFADKREHVGVLRVPVSAAGSIQTDDEVEWLDGALKGTTWRVVAEMRQTFEASGRFEVERDVSEVMRS